MSFSSTDYSADTAFERVVLERLGAHRIRIDDQGGIVDVRGRAPGGGKTISMTLTTTLGGGRQEELLLGLLAGAGLRIGEALALRWQNVDLGTGSLHVVDAKTAFHSAGICAGDEEA